MSKNDAQSPKIVENTPVMTTTMDPAHQGRNIERNTNGETDFRPLKQQFENRRFRSNEGVEMVVREWNTQSVRSPT